MSEKNCQRSFPICINFIFIFSAKSKPNAQRTASKQGSGGPNNNQKAVITSPAVSVPPPQPAKPTSKSTKKNELNLKGANKEGTDMDAFNDNALNEVSLPIQNFRDIRFDYFIAKH